MATVMDSTNQGNPSTGNPGPFPSFVNFAAPCMAIVSLPTFTIGFPICLFSTPMVPNVQIASQLSSPPLEQHQTHVYPKVDPFPSSPIVSSSLSSYLRGESLYSSSQEAKKKKKK